MLTTMHKVCPDDFKLLFDKRCGRYVRNNSQQNKEGCQQGFSAQSYAIHCQRLQGLVHTAPNLFASVFDDKKTVPVHISSFANKYAMNTIKC